MYDNIGGKIKELAKIGTIIGIILSVIVGILLITLVNSIIGIVLVFVLPIAFWISSFPLYGFGELIDKVCNMEKNARDSEKSLEKGANNEQKAEVTVNRKEMDAKRYICDSFIVTEKMASGKCMICMQNVARAKYCKIKNSIGTREIPVCQDCIAMFEKHNEPK